MVWDGQLARMPFHLKEGPQGTGVSFDVQVRRKVWYLVDYACHACLSTTRLPPFSLSHGLVSKTAQ